MRHSNLRKAIDLAKTVRTEVQIEKGLHDAIYHHALYAKAAREARYTASGPMGTEERDRLTAIERKHTWMFLRHCLECIRSIEAWDMPYKLQNAVSFYQGLVDSKQSSKELKEAIAKVVKSGYQHDADDKFIEDYEDSDGPDL